MNTRRKSLSAITADVGPVPQIPVREDSPAPPPRRRAKREHSSLPPDASPSPAEDTMDDATLGRWRWQLGATARKAVAARARADAALAAWETLVADAQSAGIPSRLVVAAAADAGLDVPGAE